MSEHISEPPPAQAVASDGVQATLRTLAERPVADHPAIFESIHAELHTALAQLDEL